MLILLKNKTEIIFIDYILQLKLLLFSFNKKILNVAIYLFYLLSL